MSDRLPSAARSMEIPLSSVGRYGTRRGRRTVLRFVPVVLLGGLLVVDHGPASAPMERPAEAVALAEAETGTCTVTPRFQALRDRLPELVGACLEDARPNPVNGNL